MSPSRPLVLSRAAVRRLKLPVPPPSAQAPRGGPNGAPAGSGPAQPLVLTLPLPEPRQSRGHRHWRYRHEERNRYLDGCLLLLAAGRLPAPPPVPHERCYISAVVRAWNPQDDDNCLGRLKHAIDFLAFRGYIVDDSRRHLRWRAVPEQVVDRRNPASVTLTLEPVASWDE